jgi:hypothetical protein
VSALQVVLILAAVLLAVLVIRSVFVAKRLDRLHRKVFASRTTLNLQLAHRGAVAAELAKPGLLDPASSILVGEAAWQALSAGGHGQRELEESLPDLAALLELPTQSPGTRAEPRGADSGSVGSHRPGSGSVGSPADSAAESAAESHAVIRAEAESDLSRTLRQVLEDPAEVATLCEDPALAELLDDLAAAWYRVQLARRFHNEAVVQTRHLRSTLLVRVFGLAGWAPMPTTVDFDDAWPVGLPRPDGAA